MKIEIWSDIICPWCYIGKRRFEQALAQFEHRDQVELHWRSFQLDPHAPRRYSGTLNDMLAAKKGISREQAAAMHAHVTALAAQEGLEYRLEQAQPGNSFDAHRLIHLAARHGLQGELKERLLQAYFSEGLPIGDRDTLAELGSAMGLPADEVQAVLAGSDYADAVRADERRAAALGIHGVPFFVIDGQYGISGAQSPAIFLEALEEIWARSHPLTLVRTSGADAAACEDESCPFDPA